MFYFHPIHKKMSETCQKLAFTHPIVVLKGGLMSNWMKKLDRVNRPLGYNSSPLIILSTLPHFSLKRLRHTKTFILFSDKRLTK